MKNSRCFLLFVISILMFSGAVLAQDYDYHPGLSDNFTVILGAFKSDNAFKISAEGSIVERERRIDFAESVGVDKSSTLLDAQLRWSFGKNRKWTLSGQYFSNDATGEAVLTEDVEWQDVTFRDGTFVGAGVDIAITRVFVGRSFIKNEQHDFGVGIGVHNLDISVFIEGDIVVDDESTEFFRGEADNSQPLPNVGTWYNYSPARNWLLHGRVDWISANIGDYDGTLWNISAGVNYQVFRHLGIDLSYEFFNLNLAVDKSDWKGDVDMRYSGPVLSVTTSW